MVEPDDLIRIDIPNRILAIIGVRGEEKAPEEIEEILAQRKAKWTPKPKKYTRGVLAMFSEKAVSPMKGAYLKYE